MFYRGTFMNIAACGAAALLFALSCSSALAMPGAGGGAMPSVSDPAERFRQMDTDNDGKLTWDELSAARPNLSRNAFDIIDSGRDGNISLDEWKTFSAGHGGSAASMPDMSKMMESMRGAGDGGSMTAPGNGMPLVMPPVQKSGSPSAAPSSPSMPGMPLITPPTAGK